MAKRKMLTKHYEKKKKWWGEQNDQFSLYQSEKILIRKQAVPAPQREAHIINAGTEHTLTANL